MAGLLIGKPDFADVGKIAVALRKINPIAHDESIGDFKSNPIGAKISFASTWFVKKCNRLQTLGLPRQNLLANVSQSVSSIDNIFDTQHIPAFNFATKILENTHFTATLHPVPVG